MKVSLKIAFRSILVLFAASIGFACMAADSKPDPKPDPKDAMVADVTRRLSEAQGNYEGLSKQYQIILAQRNALATQILDTNALAQQLQGEITELKTKLDEANKKLAAPTSTPPPVPPGADGATKK